MLKDVDYFNDNKIEYIADLDDPSDSWWITTSNSTYDIKNRTFSIYIQKNYNDCYQFKIW